LRIGRGNIDKELKAVYVCIEMKWDYYTYLDQPEWFVNTIVKKMSHDTRHAKLQQKQQKRNK